MLVYHSFYWVHICEHQRWDFYLLFFHFHLFSFWNGHSENKRVPCFLVEIVFHFIFILYRIYRNSIVGEHYWHRHSVSASVYVTLEAG